VIRSQESFVDVRQYQELDSQQQNNKQQQTGVNASNKDCTTNKSSEYPEPTINQTALLDRPTTSE